MDNLHTLSSKAVKYLMINEKWKSFKNSVGSFSSIIIRIEKYN